MFIFISILLTLIVIYIIWRRSIEKCDLDKMPGPPGWPIIGNIFDILKDRVKIFYQPRKWSKAYNGIYQINFFYSYYCVEISKPEDIEMILANPVHNAKSNIYRFLQPWLQDGLLLSNGTKWHERRKILTPAFHFNILRHFTTILEENSQLLVKIIEAELDKPKTNIIPIMSGYTLNSICETAMGTKLEESTKLGMKYKKAVYKMGSILVERLTKAWYHSDIIFNLSSYGKHHKKILNTIKEFPVKVIDDRKIYRKTFGENIYLEGEDVELTFTGNRKRMALLDILLNAEKENKIDRKGIEEEVDTFMFEGHDTISVALNFLLMSLANNNTIQNKIVEELEVVFGDSDRMATMEDLNQLKYLECCIKESLRLYPSVHFIGRNIGEKVTLSNYVIPPGTMCNIHIYDLHRSEDLYPDPLVFDPDRFLPENSIGRHPFAYLPFSAGSRNCIGQKFAMLEMKSAIAAILRKFQLHPVTKPEDIVISGDIVLRTTEPIYVKFSKKNVIDE